jgi:outer membrane receptor protein involved in Fe transport
MLWTPTENLDITGTVSWSKDTSDPRAVVKVSDANQFYLNGARLAPGTTPDFSFMGTQDYGQYLGKVGSVSENDVMLSSTGTGGSFRGSEDKRLGSSLKDNWDVGSVTLRSISSYIHNDAKLYEDADFQNVLGTGFEADPVNFPGVNSYLSLANDYEDKTKTRQFTQDFIVESNDWDQGTWMVGGQYFYEKVENSDYSLGWNNDPSLFFAPGYCGTNPFEFSCDYAQSLAGGIPAKEIDRKTDSYSLYGMLGYDLTDRLTGSVELRYVYDDVKVTTNTAIDRVSQYFMHIPIDLSNFGPGVPLPQSDSNDSSSLNPRFSLDYKLTEDAMVYGSAAKGTKPGGFGTAQMALPQPAKMDKEKLWAYELGTKTSWFDNTVVANVALFYNDYKDRQVGVTVTDPVTFWPSSGIVNAGKAETKGIEVETQWLANDYLTLAVGYAYTDAEWKDFNYSKIRPGGATVKDQAICQSPTGDCSGADIAGIPEHALTLVGNWTQPLFNTGVDWFLNTSAMYQSKRAIYDRIDTAYVDSNWLVDGQIGIQTDTWSAMIFATNLFDDDTVTWGQGYQDFSNGMYGGNFGGEPRDESVMAFLPDPRIIGVRASYSFGGN